VPSVVGLLEKRELAARERVESLREQADRLLAELRGAEADWERFVIAREAVGEVLSASDGPDACGGRAGGGGGRFGRAGAAEGLPVGVLAPDYQRIVNAVADHEPVDGDAWMDCRRIASVLGLESVPAKVEPGFRS
jgi:hypothetical protein